MKRLLNLRLYITIALFGLSLLIGGVYAVHVRAQDSNSDGTISLSVSPQILDITGNPGKSEENVFRLTNASKESVNIRAIAKNFVPRGEEGAVDLTEDSTSFSLSDWVEISPKEVEIAPSKTQDFKIVINVPKDAEPGSHFGSVVFSTIPPEQASSAALVSQEIAPVILVKVAGKINEQAEIAEFKAQKGFYSNENAIELVSRLKNTGSVHLKPTAKIQIKNMFGKEVANLDVEQRNILPDSIRQFTNEYNPAGFKIGKYTATLTLVYGDQNEIKTAETSFVIFPYQTILPFILIVAILVYVIIKFRSRIKLALKVLSGKE